MISGCRKKVRGETRGNISVETVSLLKLISQVSSYPLSELVSDIEL
jgi:hypothetical protein